MRHNLLSGGLFTLALVLTLSLLPVSAQEVCAGKKAKSYKITYELNGGKNNKKNVKNLRKGKNLTLRKPERAGYSFKGWYEKGKKVTKIKGNKKHTLTAKWEPKKAARKNTMHTAPSVNRRTAPEIEDAGGPLSAPKGEKPNEDGSRNIYPL